MPPRAVDVRTRVLVAARAEFAQHGLAGARVDRVARQAEASKERLYAYFPDKVTLFRAVLDLNAAEFQDAVTLDPGDVPGFVGAAFDHAVAQPDHLRMLTWARLEGIAFRVPGGRTATPERLAALRTAQREGSVDPSWHPEELLELLFALAHAWVHTPIGPDERTTGSESHRDAAVEAARRLVRRPSRSSVGGP